MRDNVRHLLQHLTEVLPLPAPVVEVGAFQADAGEARADMRPFFRDCLYVGGDMRPGPGVDCLLDAHRLPLSDGSAGTVLLLDTLEHVQSPPVAVREACRVLKPGGILVVSSVMNFPIHGFPSDYWRFTPAAIDYLLAALLPRTVFSQGDGEFPHTVAGVGMRPPASPAESSALCDGLEELRTRWPEDVSGGPLLVWEPATLALSQRVADRPLPELVPGRAAAQSFVCPLDNLSRIDVKMSNLGQVSACHVLFRLREEGDAGREVAAYRLYAPHVIDGGWASVPIPVQPASASRGYVLTVESPDGAPGQAVTVMASDETLYADGRLSFDGEPVEGSLCFQVYCRAPEEAVSDAAVTESTAGAPAAKRASRHDDAATGADQQAWERTRYLASVMASASDGVRADLRDIERRLEAVERVQKQALEQSTEAAALARGLRRNPLYRAWKRVFG